MKKPLDELKNCALFLSQKKKNEKKLIVIQKLTLLSRYCQTRLLLQYRINVVNATEGTLSPKELMNTLGHLDLA